MTSVDEPEREPGIPGGATPVAVRAVPAHWFAGRVHEVLDEVTTAGRVDCLTATESAETIVELRRAVARIEGVLLQVLAHANTAPEPGADPQSTVLGVAGLTGATSTTAWLAHATRTPHPGARRQVRLAERLASGAFAATEAALLMGEIDAEQAGVISSAVDDL